MRDGEAEAAAAMVFAPAAPAAREFSEQQLAVLRWYTGAIVAHTDFHRHAVAAGTALDPDCRGGAVDVAERIREQVDEQMMQAGGFPQDRKDKRWVGNEGG